VTSRSSPRNAIIQNAYVQFTVDEETTNTTPVTMTIRGQLTGNAPTFTEADGNISGRSPTTSASVTWQPGTWPTAGQAGTTQRTTNLVPVLQQIVNQGSWNAGQALALIITGTSTSKAQSRIAVARDTDVDTAPLLVITYAAAGGPTTTSTTTPSTTTTTLPPGSSVTLFSANFGGGLAGWTETGEGDWNTESLHSTAGYPASGASGSPAAHADNCDTTCTLTLRFVDVELDAGEYLWRGVERHRVGPARDLGREHHGR
jgi:hypothetical protein